MNVISFDDRGPWMQTVSRRRFHFLNPMPDDFDITDIAHSLSLLYRFVGHTTFGWSVAQHSMEVAKLILRERCDPLAALCGLLHDGHEAYIGDFSRPVQRCLAYPDALKYVIEGNHFSVPGNIRDITDSALWEAFSLPYGDEQINRIVKEADDKMCATEAHLLMGEADPCDPQGWGLPLPPVEGLVLREVDHRTVREQFLSMYFHFKHHLCLEPATRFG